MVGLRGGVGDLFYVVIVSIAESLSELQEEMYSRTELKDGFVLGSILLLNSEKGTIASR